MIEYYKKLLMKTEIQRLENCSKDCWVRVINPTNEEIDFLVKKFDLDKELLLDGLDVYEIPRIEEEKGKSYIYLNIPTKEIVNEYTGSFLVILTKEVFITVSLFDIGILDKILKTKKDFLTNNYSRCLLQILLFLSNSYSREIRGILKEVKKDRRNIKNLNEKDILDLVVQENILNEYLSSFTPLTNIHPIMLKSRAIKFKEAEKEFIEDLIVDLNQTLNSCKSTLKTITNMRSYYSTTLSNNLNKILKILTLFTVFLTIPMVLGGIYGMNISLPFQNARFIFPLLFGITILIWVVIFFLFKKIKVI